MPPRTALLLLAAALGGCAFGTLDEEARVFYSSTVLVGRVDGPAAEDGPVVVAALPDGGGAVVHQTLLHERGGYELIVPRGSYRVLAYADRNGNGRHDADEPAGEATPGRPIAAPGQGVVSMLDITLAAGSAVAPELATLPRAPRQSTQAGALATFETPALAAAAGARGYWAPLAFFRSQGGNIHFLEPYDPAKTPVLFVHGAAGSAQDWRYFVEHLDRTRYQPWLFVYPSGAAVDSMAYLLYWKLLGLQLRHGFERLHVVAHSMGGLVMRSFLLDHGEAFPQIRLFVSISTPWGGASSADLGVRYAPAVVPSWRDMQPGGRFMQGLFARRLPPGIEHDLLFGHKGGFNLLQPNNDGTVTLASQLRGPAQDEAARVFGFDEDHVSILASPRAFAQFQALLARADDRSGSAAAELALTLHYPDPESTQAPRGLPVLVLSAVGAAQPPMSIALPADSSGRRVGPLPSGLYDASVLLGGFATEPRRQRVQIGAGTLPALAFSLRPQGTLSGYVGAEVDATDRPAGSLHPPHPAPRIRAITLQGAGIVRRLQPRADDAALTVARYVDGEDDASGAMFSFVGLPAGAYTLTISAEGCDDHVSQHTVLPGRQAPWQPLLLQRRR